MANLLSLALFAGVAYFVAMSVAHFVGFKIPVLFIFYDVPSNAYQDKIISFCAFVYAIFFYTAATVPQAVPGAIAALAATVVGLSAVTLSSDLEAIMLKGTTTTPYWIQIGLIAGYVASLFALYTNAPKPKSK